MMAKIVVSRADSTWLINGKELPQPQSGILSVILYPVIAVCLLATSVCTIMLAIAAVAVVIAGLPILLLPSVRREIREKRSQSANN